MWNRKKKCKINPDTGKKIYRMKTPLQKLEKKADDLTRDIVRLVYGWKCQKCGKVITSKADAHRAHIVSRSHKILRWDLLNLLLLCFHCHQKSHSDVETKEYIKKKWPARYKYLYEGNPPNCNLMMPYMTPVEKVAWMKNVIMLLEAKLKDLK